MGLSERLASRRTTVLVVEVPGWTLTRWAVERAVRDRGWRPALSPADADLLVVCGRPGARLAAAVDGVWDQLPGPRARSRVDDVRGVDAALDRAAAELADTHAQRRDAADRPTEPPAGTSATDVPRPEHRDRPAPPPALDDPGPDDEPDDDEPDDGDAGDGEDMGDMDMGDMDMPMPGGIQLAGTGDDDQLPDPDELSLDVLHVPLGPVLPCWPAGLLLHTTLQGDLVVAAHAEVLGSDGVAPDPAQLPGAPARCWDALATLLALTGPADAATEAARLRDAALAGQLPDHRADRLRHRLRRSRLLRWSLGGLGALPDGDAHDRLLHWLDGSSTQPAITVDEVAALVVGGDLAAARLVVASLDLDTTAPVPVPAEPDR